MRFFDAHCDAVMHIEDGDFDFVAGKGRSHMDLPRLLAAGHCAQVFAIFAAASYYPGPICAPLPSEPSPPSTAGPTRRMGGCRWCLANG